MTNLFLWKAFWNLTVQGLALGSIYALIALGYTLVYGVLRLINFAHSEVFMVGTMGALVGSTKLLGIDLLLGNGDYPYKTGLALVGVLAFIAAVAMVFSGGAAVAIERVAYRPMRGSGDVVSAPVLAFLTGFVVAFFFSKSTRVDLIIGLILTGPIAYGYLRLMGRGRAAPRLAFLITAIGASTAISEAVAIWGSGKREQYQTPRVLQKKILFHFFDADVRVDYVLVIVVAIIMMIGLTVFVNRTRIGRGVRAVAQDVETARLMGVNVDKVIMITFLLGGLMAGGAAVMFTVIYDQTRYNIGFLLGIKSFTAAVLGGIGNLKGALLGGLVLGLVENYSSAIFGSQWKDVVAFVVLLVVLMFRPTGLLGESLGRARA
ncbi:MAG: branched-chain amino acid ABC transporter permease [Actinobacteria bacterium]|nr:MAG: branched-chain amino acid ABC transporter permease [Actinomycetota bacterium]